MAGYPVRVVPVTGGVGKRGFHRFGCRAMPAGVRNQRDRE
jgi:hypothetical protein